MDARLKTAVDNRLSFGLDADGYRRYRPRYPRALYEHLASLAPDRQHALDCATGSGQAAVDLAEWFDHVDAFDPSTEQLDAAEPHRRVRYRIASAEELPYPDGRFALVAAAQAAHWFDLPAFYREVRRVSRPGGVIAVWGYSYCRIETRIDAMVERVLREPIEPYWAAGNKVIVDRYRRIEFPFDELEWPAFSSTNEWLRADYMSYLRTWSAVRRYAEQHRQDIVAHLDMALAPIWPDGETRPVSFDFVGRLGRVGLER